MKALNYGPRAPLSTTPVALVMTADDRASFRHAEKYLAILPRDAMVAVWAPQERLADSLACAARARGQAYIATSALSAASHSAICIVVGPCPFDEQQLKLLLASGCSVEQRIDGTNRSLSDGVTPA